MSLFITITGIEIPGGKPEGVQDITGLSGPSSDNSGAAVEAIAVTLTGSIGLPTVPMVSNDNNIG